MTKKTPQLLSKDVSKPNCTGADKQAAFLCNACMDYWRRDVVDDAFMPICEVVTDSVNCFSEIGNPACFSPDMVFEKLGPHPYYSNIMQLLLNKNMCGKQSKQDKRQIGCLYKKYYYYAQHCGIMELDDCEKRLESVKCRMNYIQSECNTATAMKLCENYIIDGDHCRDVLTECRNMPFENDNGPLNRTYEEYIDAVDSIEDDIYPNKTSEVLAQKYNCNKINTTEKIRIINCLIKYQKRQEIPFEQHPLLLKWKIFPTDTVSLSKYCRAVEELHICLGTFPYDCVDAIGISNLFIGDLSNKLETTLTQEINLCPNKDNGLTIEELSCMLTETKFMDIGHYKCSGLIEIKYEKYIKQSQITICKLLAVHTKCGENPGKLFCEFLRVSNNGNPNDDQVDWIRDCDFYITEVCQCSEGVDESLYSKYEELYFDESEYYEYGDIYFTENYDEYGHNIEYGDYNDESGGYDDESGSYNDESGGYDDEYGGYGDEYGGYGEYGEYGEYGGYDDESGGYGEYGGYDDESGENYQGSGSEHDNELNSEYSYELREQYYEEGYIRDTYPFFEYLYQ